MIEVVLLDDEEESPYPSFGVAIDGVVEPKEKAYAAHASSGPDEFELKIFDGGVADKFMRQIWWEFPSSVIGVDMVLDRYFDWMEFDHSVRIYLTTMSEHLFQTVRVKFTVKILFDRDRKNATWNLMGYYGLLSRFISDEEEHWERDADNRPDDYIWDYDCKFLPDDFACTFSLESSEAPTAAIVPFAKFEKVMRELHEAGIEEIEQRGDENSLSLLFDFPETVRVPCEQYLQYFVQFLKDAGVGATADLTHEAGQVLFTVTPDNQDVALDKIRKALDLYLHLPSNPSYAMTPYHGESIAVQRMGITLQTFQNQLSLITMENRQLESEVRSGERVIQAQEVAIQALRFALAQQAPADPATFVQAVKVITEKDQEKDKLAILGGAASLKKIDGGWFEIDAPKIARDCKLPEIMDGVKRILNASDEAKE